MEPQRPIVDKLAWDLEVEVAKVIEVGVAMGFDFNGKGNEVAAIIRDREMVDVRRLSKNNCSACQAAKTSMKRGVLLKKPDVFSITEFEKRIEMVDKKAVSDGWSDLLRNDRIGIIADMWKAIRKEEQMWSQKSRIKWLKEGDKNSKFFHSIANGRSRINYIGDLVVEGRRVSDPKLVSIKWVPEEERDSLERVFSIEEVWEAVCNCDGNKALGSDGLNLNFIKAHWGVIKDDVMRFFHGFYEEGFIIKDLNITFIALIPKCARLETMQDFRPISLVGCMYKILAKVLANRVKMVMDLIIGETQMAFVRNRQILDSFVIAGEIIHKWSLEEEGGLLVKLDFEKAYDSVDQEFLLSLMSDMGFGERWRSWIRNCISSPRLSVLVNGSPTTQFGLERVTEGLSDLLRKAVDVGMIEWVVFGNNAVHITHLQFADDTILFLKPNVDYLRNLRRILRCFELATRLRINFHKSCVVKVGNRISTDDSWAEVFRCKKGVLLLLTLDFPWAESWFEILLGFSGASNRKQVSPVEEEIFK
ncbi:hypothetical protein Dsin_018470 [Dipteronia sinensis]|uniref:Reverse transcriptase domain-containing protein n=1 Tax=Dipteronia sinensis TaxID=43782 RepID=A0AAE0A654_9ROSI|nr:hypothetical protein Dsin_018470 [Dipteronia sinensis]